MPYRDISGWLASGLPLSTPSNTAAKLFDAWQMQSHAYCDDESVGGLMQTGRSILTEDPQFIFFDVMETVYNYHSVQSDDMAASQAGRVGKLRAVCESHKSSSGHSYSDWEIQHCRAALLYAQGHRNRAECLWENILALYPQDIIANNMCLLQAISNAQFHRTRDTFLASLPSFKKSDPYYGYILSKTGFTMEQTGHIRRAEEMISESLQINPRDVWGVHSLAHVFESEGRCEEGERFMASHEADWRVGVRLEGHNWWHWALFQLDLGQTEEVLATWESHFLPSAQSSLHEFGSYFQMSDAVSLLLRLENESALCHKSLSHQWNSVIERLMPAKLGSTGQSFYDYHLAMAMACGRRPDLLETFKTNQEEYFSKEDIVSDYSLVARGVGAQAFKAMEHIAEENWAPAADILFDLRHSVWQTGGSLAQRDYWNHLLVKCLWQAGRPEDLARLKSFLKGRVMLRGRCGMSERVSQAVLEQHDAQINAH